MNLMKWGERTDKKKVQLLKTFFGDFEQCKLRNVFLRLIFKESTSLSQTQTPRQK